MSTKSLYIAKCAEALNTDIALDVLTPTEAAKAEELDRLFASPEWLYQKGGLRQAGVKIHADVRVVEGAHKAPGGLIRVVARLRGDCIEDVSLSGDFTVQPADSINALETALRGARPERGEIHARVSEWHDGLHVQSPGVNVDDWTQAVMRPQDGARV